MSAIAEVETVRKKSNKQLLVVAGVLVVFVTLIALSQASSIGDP